jgi:signal transduction histidine kinase
MRLYQQLSGIRFLRKNYSLKFLFIAFLGIHIPLIGIIVYLVFFRTEDHISPLNIFMLTLVLTLSATAATLFVLNHLLSPIRLSKDTLVNFIQKNTRPNLPEMYLDEAGVLMQSVQYSLNRLQKMDDERNDLLSLLSHDLRTPLTQIISINRLLKTEKDMSRISEYTSMIDYCVDNQLKLVENIFLVLKLKDYEIKKDDITPVSLKALVDKQVSLMETKLSDKKLTILTSVPDTIMVEVKTVLFERVIFNLLINAIKFSYVGGEISITASQEHDRINMKVADNGMGFHPQQAEELFKRFTPAGKKGTSGEPSEGLGLYLSRKITEQHKGSVTAASNGPNQGATFTVTLPLHY